jgi:hypothetical protein
MARKATKAAAVLEMLNKGMSSKQIRERFKVSPSYIWKMKKEMAHKADDQLVELLEEWRNEPEIDEVLTARHNNYGTFYDLARVAQEFKSITHLHLIHANKHLEADQHEALELIFTKIARIINGNADNVDSWVDIAGYAKLVADRLQGTVR